MKIREPGRTFSGFQFIQTQLSSKESYRRNGLLNEIKVDSIEFVAEGGKRHVSERCPRVGEEKQGRDCRFEVCRFSRENRQTSNRQSRPCFSSPTLGHLSLTCRLPPSATNSIESTLISFRSPLRRYDSFELS